jgi:hypothetical protein
MQIEKQAYLEFSDYAQYRDSHIERNFKKLKEKYGMSETDFYLMLHNQDNCCAICKCKIKSSTCNVDHDHKTGKVRGLLCPACNTGLGMFHDSINDLYSAVNYLEENI